MKNENLDELKLLNERLQQEMEERKRAGKTLQEREARLRAIFDATENVSFIMTDLTGTEAHIVEFSPGAERIFGYSREEVIGKSVAMLHLPEDARFPQVVDVTRQRKIGVRAESTLVRKSGEKFLALFTIYPVFAAEGNVAAALGVCTDITERKREEEELKAAQEYAQNLIDSSLDMIISVDQDRRIVEFNLAAQKTFGYSKAEVLGKDVDILYADPTEGSKVHGATRRTGGFIGEIVNKRKNGETFPTFLAASAMQDAKGKFLGLMGVSRDITERKRLEEDATRRHRELTALHNVLISITQTLDLEEVLKEIVSQAGTALGSEYTSIVMVNQDGSFGIGSEDFVYIPRLPVRARPHGVTARIITSGEPVVIDDVDAHISTNPALMAAGIKSYAGVPINTKDATIGVLFVHSRQRNAFSHRMELLTAFASQAAIAMENARLYKEASTVGALREADRLKTELLANVSHELRTPLASIKGHCTSMLRYYERLTDGNKCDSLHEINQACNRLTELIENLLQLSRLEAAGLHAEKEPTRIESIINGAVEDIKEKAKGHHFVTHAEKPLSVVQADPGRIRQVLDNLLSNAVKYSSEGTEISVQCESKGQELVVSVRDQGIGIAPQEIDKVFDRFYQVNPGLCQKGGGAGLGLAICKRIIEAHRGRVWVESTPGQGSTFTFSLPLMAEGNL